GVMGVQKTTREIMAMPMDVDPAVSQARANWELQQPDRSQLSEAPGAQDLSTWPAGAQSKAVPGPGTFSPQTPDLSFTGAVLSEPGSFPPDNMGTVGPSQYFVFVNGRLRTFNKTTGLADGVINANPDVFFASVMTPVGGTVTLNFTSDPTIRYDRLSGRWFL